MSSVWPVLRTLTWMLAAGALLVAGLVLAAVPPRAASYVRLIPFHAICLRISVVDSGYAVGRAGDPEHGR